MAGLGVGNHVFALEDGKAGTPSTPSPSDSGGGGMPTASGGGGTPPASGGGIISGGVPEPALKASEPDFPVNFPSDPNLLFNPVNIPKGNLFQEAGAGTSGTRPATTGSGNLTAPFGGGALGGGSDSASGGSDTVVLSTGGDPADDPQENGDVATQTPDLNDAIGTVLDALDYGKQLNNLNGDQQTAANDQTPRPPLSPIPGNQGSWNGPVDRPTGQAPDRLNIGPGQAVQPGYVPGSFGRKTSAIDDGSGYDGTVNTEFAAAGGAIGLKAYSTGGVDDLADDPDDELASPIRGDSEGGEGSSQVGVSPSVNQTSGANPLGPYPNPSDQTQPAPQPPPRPLQTNPWNQRAVGQNNQGQQQGSKPTPAAYISGQDAVPSHVANFYEKQVDPTGKMDPAERNLRAIAAAPDPATQYGMVQYNRRKYGAMRAIAIAALKGSPQRPPDMNYASQALTAAFDAVPDGNKVQFTPNQRGGVTVSVTNIAKAQKQKMAGDVVPMGGMNQNTLGAIRDENKEDSDLQTAARGGPKYPGGAKVLPMKPKGFAAGGIVGAYEGGDEVQALPDTPAPDDTYQPPADIPTVQQPTNTGQSVDLTGPQVVQALSGQGSFFDRLVNNGMYKWIQDAVQGQAGGMPGRDPEGIWGGSMAGQAAPAVAGKAAAALGTALGPAYQNQENPNAMLPPQGGQPTPAAPNTRRTVPDVLAPMTGDPNAPTPKYGPASWSSNPEAGRAKLDENGMTPGTPAATRAAARANPEEARQTVFSNRIKGAPQDIQDLADGIYGAWSSTAGQKNAFIGQLMEDRWKQEALIKQWQGRGLDAAALHGQVQAAMQDKNLALKYAQLGAEKYKDTIGPAINAMRSIIAARGVEGLDATQKQLLAIVSQAAIVDQLQLQQSTQGMNTGSTPQGQPQGGLQPGYEYNGFIFQGGDPHSPASWKRKGS